MNLKNHRQSQSIDVPWWLYVIECQGGGLYVGISKDVLARYEKHAQGKGAMYTRLNRPVRLLCQLEYSNHQKAAHAECQIKKMSREKKIEWLLFNEKMAMAVNQGSVPLAQR